MKLKREYAQRIHSEYIKDDCVQLMTGFVNYAQLYGNGKLMYNCYLPNTFIYDKQDTADINVDKTKKHIHDYLSDERRFDFPYSSIPFHEEKIGLFKKCIFANQILDYEKPYITVFDGFITKMTAYKDDEGAIIHTEILNNKRDFCKKIIISKYELEKYLKTGELRSFDCEKYDNIQIFDINSVLYDVSLRSDEYYMDLTKKELANNIYDYLSNERRYHGIFDNFLENYNETLSYKVLSHKKMIKFKKTGEIRVDNFSVTYIDKGLYLIQLSKVPIFKDDLSDIKERIGQDNIKYCESPKINTNKRKILTFKRNKENTN